MFSSFDSVRPAENIRFSLLYSVESIRAERKFTLSISDSTKYQESPCPFVQLREEFPFAGQSNASAYLASFHLP